VVLVVEPSFESIMIAEKIRDLAAGMNKAAVAVLNKVPSEQVVQRLEADLRDREIEVIGMIPNDPDVVGASLEGRPLDKGEALGAARDIFDKLMSGAG